MEYSFEITGRSQLADMVRPTMEKDVRTWIAELKAISIFAPRFL
jgi:hypothetical protein